MPNQTRMKYVYRGRVQGVGFRATVEGLASNFSINGWVRNCEDGSVECVIEGLLPEIHAFDKAIRESRSRHIDDVQATKGAWSGDLDGFEIRF